MATPKIVARMATSNEICAPAIMPSSSSWPAVSDVPRTYSVQQVPAAVGVCDHGSAGSKPCALVFRL